MPRPLDDIRTEIDKLDRQIVTSLFEDGADKVVPISDDITAEEIVQIRALQLRFSVKTWNLLNQRMALSREVGTTKKAGGKKVVIDTERFKVVITKAQSHAPEYAREEIRKLYELIHDISVRIQNEIIGTQ